MTVSLLESESTGGAVARGGFEYQDAFVLQHLPLWLSQDAFSHVVSEAVGDVEVCYHRSGGGVIHIFHEAKNHALAATAFWEEIARFKTVHDASPAEFPRFVLVCSGFNAVTSPLVAKLERLRGVGSAYEAPSPILTTGRQEIVDWVAKNGQSAETAEFVLDHVDFVSYTSVAADAAFAGEVARYLPSVDITSSQVTAFRDACNRLVNRSSYGPVYRRDVEAALVNAAGAHASVWLATPSRVRLASEAVPAEELGLVIGPFNGPDRGRRTGTEWDALANAAAAIGDFLKASRDRRCVALDAKQRMSVACLLGYAFSATRGFMLQIEHNTQVYRTDNHDRTPGQFFHEQTRPGESAGTEGVVCVGFPTAIGDDFKLARDGVLSGIPCLALDSTKVMTGMESLNAAVAEAKTAMVRFRSEFKLEKIHLFLKAPSAFAMALGYRLNGVCAFELYDWIDGRYVATATLAP